jgi:hypothetical protein
MAVAQAIDAAIVFSIGEGDVPAAAAQGVPPGAGAVPGRGGAGS